MSDTPQREMTLDEYVSNLPRSHGARKQLDKLCALVDRLRLDLADMTNARNRWFTEAQMLSKPVPEDHCVCPDPIVGISKDGAKSLCSICTKEWDEKKWSTHVPIRTTR